MRVITVDLHRPPKPDEVQDLWGLDRLNDFCAEADVVLIACPAVGTRPVKSR